MRVLRLTDPRHARSLGERFRAVRNRALLFLLVDTAGRRDELWVDEYGRPVQANWLYLTLRRLGERAGVPNLRTHRFRHTYATTDGPVAELRGLV